MPLLTAIEYSHSNIFNPGKLRETVETAIQYQYRHFIVIGIQQMLNIHLKIYLKEQFTQKCKKPAIIYSSLVFFSFSVKHTVLFFIIVMKVNGC